MKKTFLLVITVFFIAATLLAQPPKGNAKKGSSYGEKITVQDAIAPDNVANLLKENESADVKVKGKVVEVCSAKGCFIYIKTATGKMYIKTKDDAFFVPLALKGKTVVIKGTASADKDSKEISIQATGILVI
jgi:Domain of unknown function (DUF4920)